MKEAKILEFCWVLEVLSDITQAGTGSQIKGHLELVLCAISAVPHNTGHSCGPVQETHLQVLSRVSTEASTPSSTTSQKGTLCFSRDLSAKGVALPVMGKRGLGRDAFNHLGQL
jgi:hypothetical protein